MTRGGVVGAVGVVVAAATVAPTMTLCTRMMVPVGIPGSRLPGSLSRSLFRSRRQVILLTALCTSSRDYVCTPVFPNPSLLLLRRRVHGCHSLSRAVSRSLGCSCSLCVFPPFIFRLVDRDSFVYLYSIAVLYLPPAPAPSLFHLSCHLSYI